MNKSWINLIMGVGLAGSVAMAAGTANAEEHETAAGRAKADFVNYCASCHGLDGTGNGPMASELKGKPADLTLLSKNNGGKFPYMKIRKTVDGSMETGSLRAHSSKEMPVWGDVFRRGAGADGSKYMVAQARIMSIIDYIAAQQK
ncbi:MAG: cytochrome C [Gammaproteobacteria bacterium]|nr:MAG: cytochrome C [Gammaproteobacteria bacterium]